MLKHTIDYVDFNGNNQSEEVYFNMTKSELVELYYSKDGGFEAWIEEMTQNNRASELLPAFKNIVISSYGRKSADGKKFIKDPVEAEQFTYTAAFDELFFQIMSDAEFASKFINGVVPANLQDAVNREVLKREERESKTYEEPEPNIPRPE